MIPDGDRKKKKTERKLTTHSRITENTITKEEIQGNGSDIHGSHNVINNFDPS